METIIECAVVPCAAREVSGGNGLTCSAVPVTFTALLNPYTAPQMPRNTGSGRGGRSGGADAPSSSRGATGEHGYGTSAHADESNFAERITFAGKLEHFVVAHDTYYYILYSSIVHYSVAYIL